MAPQCLRSTMPSAALLALALVLPCFAAAATLTVTDLGDSGAPGQLRTLINAAAPGDTIVIPAGTITLTGPAGENANVGGDLDIAKSLTIQGAGPGATIIDGAGIDRVMTIITNTGTVAISGLTLRNGVTTGGGAGILIGSSNTVSLTSVTISDNHATGSSSGGGISNSLGSTVTLTNISLNGNTAGGDGGAIKNGGGGANSMFLTGVTISGSTAGGQGGAIANGGNGADSMSLTNVTISGNTATGISGGGGISNFLGDSLTLLNVTISGNTATGIFGGGGINNAATITLTNVTLSGNMATAARGGGIRNTGTGTLTNVTISGNTATGSFGGGGIANAVNGNLTFTNVTITGNTVVGTTGTPGAGIDNFGSQTAVTLKNVLLSGNTIPGSARNCANSLGVFTSLGNNLDSGTTCGFAGPGDRTNTNPLLGPLQDNGGPTQTHALLEGSPAIDSGDNTGCPATDQRGVTRPQDGNSDGSAICDIGAYEVGTGDPTSAFVTRLYQTVLLREPDAPGLAAHVADIQAFGTVIPTVLAFFHSAEFLSQPLTDDQFLDRLYHTFLNRPPDPQGLQAFQALLASGCRTRDTLIAALTFSDEFQSLVPPLPVADLRVPFVAELYAWILNRPPDPALQGWVTQLQRSTALATVLSFLHSPEFTTPRRDTAPYVNALYLAFLGRPPDCGGLTFWVTTLTQQGDTEAARDQVAGQFAASQEFQTKLDQLFP